jgi:hypothetical protein
MDGRVRWFPICVVLRAGIGSAANRSLIQGIPSIVYKIWKEKKSTLAQQMAARPPMRE